MTWISLVCLLALSSTVFSASIMLPSANGYGSTRSNPPPSVNYGYGSTRSNPPPTVNYGYGSTRSNPPPTVNYGYGSTQTQTGVRSSVMAPPVVDTKTVSLSAATELDRQAQLNAEQFVFDFVNSLTGVSTGAGGQTVAATAKNFPALIGHGVAMTIGNLGPCGINLPHTHPRATEINFAVFGTLETGFFQENGARFIMNTLTAGKATVFPQGAIHFEQNLNCEPAMFVAAFNSADPGVQTVASSFYGGLPVDIVGASLGGLNITTVESMAAMLPSNPALGIEECRARCGL